MDCIILEKGECEITQLFSNSHEAIDIVGKNYTLDYIVAHNDGVIDDIKDNRSNMKGSTGNLAYGNYIKIKHPEGYYTLYAHLKSGLNFKKNQKIKKGQVIGYMWDSGNAYGKHLHFEIWKNNKRIDPIEYLKKELPSKKTEQKLKYQIGDIVEINGVYISSDSEKRLTPLITKGKTTKIIKNKNNPYLLEDGNIGWINEDVIIKKINNSYLSNKNYTGTSIVDALKEIKIDSSYQYRSELAKLNNINNYKGTKEQNIVMLQLLKNGNLKY